MKAAQLGLTSKAMLRCCYAARYFGYRGILYLFPSKSDVSEFSKARISPLVEDNPETIGQWVQETDSVNLKKIWQCFSSTSVGCGPPWGSNLCLFISL
jgi:phage terminase large subunit GpA-like protein